MPRARTGLQAAFAAMLVICIALAAPAGAQKADISPAVDLVRLFIAEHARRFNAGSEPLLNDRAAARRFLVDEMAIEGLQGKLQFDPVYGAQDADVSALKVYADPQTPLLRGAAQVRVDLTNFGAKRGFVYTLVGAPNGQWQISDIYSEDDGWSLAEMIRQKGLPLAPREGAEVTLSAAAGGDQKPGAAPSQSGPQNAQASGTPAGGQSEQIGMEQGDLPGDGDVSGGSDLLFILDASGSMWGQVDGVAKITTAKQALSGLIGDLNAKTKVGLISYGHRREGDCGDIEVVLPVAKHAPGLIGPAIGKISPRGKTPIAKALEAAAGAFPSADRQANVLLISDGLETCGGDPCAAAQALAARGINTRVHVVGFDLKEEEHKALQCIAEKGGGNYYSANNAREFVDAVNEAVESVEQAKAPEPQPVAQSHILFEDKFEGDAIDPAWGIVNPAERLAALDGNGAFLIAAVGKTAHFDSAKAHNRLLLDQELPKGDFDLLLEFRMPVQTRQEHVSLSLFEDAHNQIGALLWIKSGGCGPQLQLSLVKVSGKGGGKPQKTAFAENLFDGPILDNVCSKRPRAYADAVLEKLEQDGATIRLKRRGRKVTASLDIQLPEFDGHAAKPFHFESEAITALKLSGKPSVLTGHWHKAAPGESHFMLDRFAIEKPAQ